MKVIGIETSGNIGGVAVCQDKRIVTAKNFGDMQHGKELIPAIKGIFHEIGWEPKDIDLIAVDVGPGSYTGLRVGVTCAKTLAYVLNKPVIDVPVFDIIAENYNPISPPISPPSQGGNNEKIYPKNFRPSSPQDKGEAKDPLHKNGLLSEYYICPVFDARRNHVYACIYKLAINYHEQELEGIWQKRVSEFLVIQPEKLVSILPRPVIIFGDGVPPYKKIFHQKDIFIDKEEHATPTAEHVALLGEGMFESGHRCDIDKLLPLYLRQAEAIEKREGKK